MHPIALPSPGRRAFIRVLGGSAIAAAVPSMTAGCSDAYPEVALAPWRGPNADEPPARWALAHAILAPSSHNRQPWLVSLREPDAITLFVDRQRLLPETDPWFRQIVVSQGTFLEALVLALRERGVQPTVTLFPAGEFAPRTLDDRPVARIAWSPPTGGPLPKDPLFAQILKRHTAKVDYDTTRPVVASTLDALRDAVGASPDVRFGATVEPARVAALRTLCWESARVELLTPRTVMESVRLTRVGPDEIAAHRDGISVNSAIPRLAAAVGAFDRDNPPAAGSTAYEQMMSRFEGHSRTAMGFVWLSTTAGSRAAEVAAGRAYMRLQLKATELGLQVHPMSQAAQEFAEMRPHFDALHSQLVGRPASEETVQMVCRVGHCAPQQHAPRRGVDAVVRA